MCGVHLPAARLNLWTQIFQSNSKNGVRPIVYAQDSAPHFFHSSSSEKSKQPYVSLSITEILYTSDCAAGLSDFRPSAVTVPYPSTGTVIQMKEKWTPGGIYAVVSKNPSNDLTEADFRFSIVVVYARILKVMTFEDRRNTEGHKVGKLQSDKIDTDVLEPDQYGRIPYIIAPLGHGHNLGDVQQTLWMHDMHPINPLNDNSTNELWFRTMIQFLVRVGMLRLAHGDDYVAKDITMMQRLSAVVKDMWYEGKLPQEAQSLADVLRIAAHKKDHPFRLDDDFTDVSKQCATPEALCKDTHCSIM